LYREEVSPRIDILFDCSDSMSFDSAKRQRAFELLYFCVESALQMGASLNCYTLDNDSVNLWPPEFIEAAKAPNLKYLNCGDSIRNVPWRADSLRVWISDLLFPAAPESMLAEIGRGRGRGVLFAIYCSAEASPDWDGNIEFEDCESGFTRSHHVSSSLKTRYLDAYKRHFSLWEEESHRHGIRMARIAAEIDFSQALQQEALPQGALEWRK
ncbi:MAG: hypothetical protein ACK5NG_00555, partial [Chthoniobacterales bacterium]